MILHSPNDTLKFTDANNTSSARSNIGTERRAVAPATSGSNTTYDEDLIFIVGDVYNSLSSIVLQTYLAPDGPDGNLGDEPVPDGGLVNGIGQSNCAFAPAGTPCDEGANYNFTVEAGKRYRMRVINAGSFADIRFSVGAPQLCIRVYNMSNIFIKMGTRSPLSRRMLRQLNRPSFKAYVT